MERTNRKDTKNIITIEDAITELNRLYVEMTYDVEFMERAIEERDNSKILEEKKKEFSAMRKYIDDKFENDSVEKIKYLVTMIKEMLIKTADESKSNITIKNMLRNQYRKYFAEVVILLDELKLADINALGFGNILADLEFSKEEEMGLYDKLEASKIEERISKREEENEILSELNKSKIDALKDITLITDISEDDANYGAFAKDKDNSNIICENENGQLIALSNYKAYQNKKDGNNLTKLSMKSITQYEFQLRKEDGKILSITFFGDSDLEEDISEHGSDYLKAMCLAILAARNNPNTKREHIGSIEKLDDKIFRAIYDDNLEGCINQLVSNENKRQAYDDKNINKKRDEQK